MDTYTGQITNLVICILRVSAPFSHAAYHQQLSDFASRALNSEMRTPMLSYEQHLRQPHDAMRCVVRVQGLEQGGGYLVSGESQKIVRHRRRSVPIATKEFEFRDDAIEFAASVVEECVLNQGFVLCD